MSNRPHFELRAGDHHVIIGYEAQGDGWNVYRRKGDNPPTVTSQQWYPTTEEAHSAFISECTKAIAAVANPGHAAPFKGVPKFIKDLTSFEGEGQV